MKQPLLLAATIALVPFAAQARTQDAGLPGSTPGSASAAWGWKIQPAVGSRYVLRTFSRSEMQMGFPNAPAPTRAGAPKVPTSASTVSHSSSVADYEVLSRDAQGATTVKLTYRSFDSGSSTATPGASRRPLTASQEASGKMLKNFMVGVSLTMKIAPDGKIWSVLGLDKLRARLLQSLAGTPGAGAIAQSLSGFFSEAAYKKALSQSTGQLPPFAIAPGDSWPIQSSLMLPMGIGASTQGTRLLLARRDGVATIKENAALNMTQDPSTEAPASASALGSLPRTTMRMRGTTTGSTKVDEASGLPLEANSTTTMSGRISVDASSLPAPKPRPGAAPNPTSMTVTMSMRTASRTVMEPVATPGA